MFNSIRKDRKSVFREVGLATEGPGTISPRVVLADPFELEHERRHVAAEGLAPLNTTAIEQRGTSPSAHEPAEQGDEDSNTPGGVPPQPTNGVSAQSDAPMSPQSPSGKTPWYAKLPTGRRARVRVGSSAPPSPVLGVSTMTMLVLAVAIMAPTFLGRGDREALGVVDAGPIVRRADSPTNVCARWAQQSKWPNLSRIMMYCQPTLMMARGYGCHVTVPK